jgi:transcriptional regulator with XRE-family HTH domain
MKKEIVKLLRNTLGLTQRQFAEKVGISHGLAGYIETGARLISPTTERKIKQAFQLTEDKLAQLTALVNEIKGGSTNAN